MAARAVELADAVVERINAGTYSLNATARRRAVPFYSIEEMQGLQVSVFTGTRAAERLTREDPGQFMRTYRPVVAIQKKLEGTDDDAKLNEADQLQALTEEIEEQLEHDLAGMAFVGFGEEQPEDSYNLESMRSLGTFAALITLEYADAD